MRSSRVAGLLACCLVAVLVACSGESGTPPDPETPGVVGTPGTVPADEALNDFERRLIPVMEAVGVSGAGVAEHGFDEAWISGEWRDGEALVHGYEHVEAAAPGDVVDSMTIAGVDAEVVTTNWGETVRFNCGDDGYDVHVPREADDAAELAELLIQELGC